MKKGIIFDLDGTLIDTPSGIVDTIAATVETFDQPARDPSEIRATIGMPLESALASMLNFQIEDERVAQAVKTYQRLFKGIVLPKAESLIFDGVVDGLETLKSKGYILAVATSKVMKSAESLIRAAGLWQYFDLVVGADCVTHPKPHSEMGELVMSTLSLKPENSIMIGDTTHDLFMAQNCGMQSIAVTYGVHNRALLQTAEPNHIVDDFNQVLSCILEEEAIA